MSIPGASVFFGHNTRGFSVPTAVGMSASKKQRCQIQWVLTGCLRHFIFDLTLVKSTIVAANPPAFVNQKGVIDTKGQ